MAITGHKSEATTHQYKKKCPPKKICEMSYILTQPLVKKPKIETVTKAQDSAENISANILTKQNQNIQLLPFDINDTDDDILVKFLNETEDIMNSNTDQADQTDQNQVVPFTTTPTVTHTTSTTISSHTINSNMTANPQNISE